MWYGGGGGYSQPFSSWELTEVGSRARNWPIAAMSPSLAAIQTFGEGIFWAQVRIASFRGVGAQSSLRGDADVFLLMSWGNWQDLCRCQGQGGNDSRVVPRPDPILRTFRTEQGSPWDSLRD